MASYLESSRQRGPATEAVVSVESLKMRRMAMASPVYQFVEGRDQITIVSPDK
jgi:hypothetical protein